MLSLPKNPLMLSLPKNPLMLSLPKHRLRHGRALSKRHWG
jgi:hypothetical protein